MSGKSNKGGCLTVFAAAFLAFFTYAKLSGTQDTDKERLTKDGVIGVWHDDVGDAETIIERVGLYDFKLSRTNADGSKGDYPLRYDGEWLLKNDKFGTKYRVDGDTLEVFDAQGYIRSMKLKPNKE